MAKANSANARLAVIVGDEELSRNEATVKDLGSGEQITVPIPDLPTYVIEKLNIETPAQRVLREGRGQGSFVGNMSAE
jgi:hypothetical protein